MVKSLSPRKSRKINTKFISKRLMNVKQVTHSCAYIALKFRRLSIDNGVSCCFSMSAKENDEKNTSRFDASGGWRRIHVYINLHTYEDWTIANKQHSKGINCRPVHCSLFAEVMSFSSPFRCTSVDMRTPEIFESQTSNWWNVRLWNSTTPSITHTRVRSFAHSHMVGRTEDRFVKWKLWLSSKLFIRGIYANSNAAMGTGRWATHHLNNKSIRFYWQKQTFH